MVKVIMLIAAMLVVSSTANAKDVPLKTASLPSHGVVYGSVGDAYGVGRRTTMARAKKKRPRTSARTLSSYSRHISTWSTSKSLDTVTPALAEKVREIQAACGSTIASAHRSGARIRGTGKMSLHSRYPSEAVDLRGNPSCIYSHLRGWAGGYSTDYGRVSHVHISLSSDGRERGLRFSHGYSKKRYVKAKRRYANVK